LYNPRHFKQVKEEISNNSEKLIR